MSQYAILRQTGEHESRYLSFSLGGEAYAIPLLQVREVLAMPEITPVPTMPAHFLGIMNLRGQVISVIDLRRKLGVKPSESSEVAVIITDLGSICIGVVVDSINAVVAPLETDITDAPGIRDSKVGNYVTKIFREDKSVIMLMDIAKVLNVDDRKAADKKE